MASGAFDDDGSRRSGGGRRQAARSGRSTPAGTDEAVVAAEGDGTIRWRRADDGRELLTLQVLQNKTDWSWSRGPLKGSTRRRPAPQDAAEMGGQPRPRQRRDDAAGVGHRQAASAGRAAARSRRARDRARARASRISRKRDWRFRRRPEAPNRLARCCMSWRSASISFGDKRRRPAPRLRCRGRPRRGERTVGEPGGRARQSQASTPMSTCNICPTTRRGAPPSSTPSTRWRKTCKRAARIRTSRSSWSRATAR